MSFSRKLQRKQGQALTELGKATKQIADLNSVLKYLPEVYEKLEDSGKVLEAVLKDMEELSKEQEFTLFLVRKLLTQEQEDRYRAEWLASRETSECPPESSSPG